MLFQITKEKHQATTKVLITDRNKLIFRKHSG